MTAPQHRQYNDRHYDGRMKGTMPAGVCHPDVAAVIREYQLLNTEEARGAFADKMVSNLARRLDRTWPVLYDLLRIIRDNKVYEQELLLECKQTFPTFEAYFEAVVAQPFGTWADLEATHHFVASCKPELFHASFGEARAEALKAQLETVAPSMTTEERNERFKAKASEAGKAGMASRWGEGEGEKDNDGSNATIVIKQERGTPYLLARMKRDAADPAAPNRQRAQEALDGIDSGRFKSARAAGLHAGIVRPQTALRALQLAWSKATKEDRLSLLSGLASEAGIPHESLMMLARASP